MVPKVTVCGREVGAGEDILIGSDAMYFSLNETFTDKMNIVLRGRILETRDWEYKRIGKQERSRLILS